MTERRRAGPFFRGGELRGLIIFAVLAVLGWVVVINTARPRETRVLRGGSLALRGHGRRQKCSCSRRQARDYAADRRVGKRDRGRTLS